MTQNWLELVGCAYLVGIPMAWLYMMVAQRLYKRETDKKIDWWWITKISTLSWLTVVIAMLIVKETVSKITTKQGADNCPGK